MNKAFEIAINQYGTKEIPGSVHNPVVVGYFREIGHAWVKDDETAWCAAFVNWCLLKAGKQHTGKLNARSFLTYGTRVFTPQVGDLVVLWRDSIYSEKGHVGFFVRELNGNIFILGGNQTNQVNIASYPKTQLLEYRRIS